MVYKWLSLIILFCFINNIFIGCTSWHKKLFYEINSQDHIKKVVKPDGQIIRFDFRGGFLFHIENPGIAGRTIKGSWVVLQLNDVKELHKTSPKITNWRSRLRGKKITEVITKESKVIGFNTDGAVYVDSIKIIKGITLENEEVKYQLMSIKGARTELPEIISKDSLLKNDLFIAEILTNDNKLIIFDRLGGIFVEPSNVVAGFTPKGSIVRLNRDQVDIGYVNKLEHGTTFMAGLIASPLLLLLFAHLFYGD
jgi:hypothetical protein